MLGHGRGDLPDNFRPCEVTTQELNDILGSLREVSDKKQHIRSRPGRITAGSPVKGTSTMTEAIWELDLDLLPQGPPCRAMQIQVDVITKAMANGSRHDATLGPVLQLVRLGAQRHQGLVESLQSLKSVYVNLVAPDRDGGIQEAEREWSRAQGGALEIVFPRAIALSPDAVCECWLSDYRSSLRQDDLFARQGRAKVTDRAVLAYLLEKARLNKSRRVREAQRQMAEHIDIQHRTVSKSLGRLEHGGWFTRTRGSGPGAIDTITLVLPEKAVSTPTELPTGGSTSVGVLTDFPVHRLFGSAGLGRGVAETFAALPEWHHATGRGFLIRVSPGSQNSELLLDPRKGSRRIPPPPKGRGLTVAQLVERTDKAPGTVRLHLKKLFSRGMVFKDNDGLWWRYRLDPDQLADKDEVPHTAHLKAKAHTRERRSYYRGLIRSDQVRNRTPSVQLVHGLDGDTYVNPSTGEILWIDTDPPETDPDGTSGLS
jgi:DNA-binding transcriptional ArsR family regulator